MFPDTVSEAEFLRVTSAVAKTLYPKYGAVHGSPEDFAQEVVVWALQALSTYDSSRSLDGYLFTVAKTRALNVIRDKVTRNDPPCRRCHAGDSCGPDRTTCPKYTAWFERNRAKANLARPQSLLEASDTCERQTPEPSAEAVAEARELTDLVDRYLPLALRADYLRLVAGEMVPKPRRLLVQQAVRDILDPSCYDARKACPRFEAPAVDDLFDPDDEDE